MKLRIHANSVRVRLTQSEVRSLADGQRIEQATEFPESSRLITQIELSGEIRQSTATFDGGRLTLRLPLDQVRQWAQTNQVGIESDQPIGDGRSLHILIEKDFDCVHPRLDEDIDTFPNPKRSRLA
jgi:uncharacterized protein DUF7009